MGFVERVGKGKTRTFRIDEAIDSELIMEAETRGVSVNNLAESIFEKHLNFNRWYERLDSISLTPQTFSALLEEIDDEAIREIGCKMGVSAPKMGLMIRGISLNMDSARLFIEKILGEYNQWFDVSYIDHKKPYFYIRNSLGEKWIIFIEAYLCAFLIECIGVQVTCKRMENNLQITLDKS